MPSRVSLPQAARRAAPARGRATVIGAGWAGIAAAVGLVDAGWDTTVLELAARPGGRARGVEVEGLLLDNGQHILIGAYTETLRLMRRVGVDTDACLDRRPLAFVDGRGQGLQLPPGPALLAFARGVLGHPDWRMADKAALLARAGRWALSGFACGPDTTVADLARGLPDALQHRFIEPLCVAALNTPADEASGTVFLRVLKDALFSGSGSSDLLLPRASLDDLLPSPAARALAEAGARLRFGHRVAALRPLGQGWSVDGEPCDRVVLATPPREAARLVRPFAPEWADRAEALRYEPIVTVYVRLPGLRLVAPMVALPSEGESTAAQFAFDLGWLRPQAETRGLVAFVISGAAPWIERGQAATEAAVMDQAAALAGGSLPAGARVLQGIAEKRATFRCTPDAVRGRPAAAVAPGLRAAGDYVAGPYPATLEGAVRSGRAAALGSDAPR